MDCARGTAEGVFTRKTGISTLSWRYPDGAAGASLVSRRFRNSHASPVLESYINTELSLPETAPDIITNLGNSSSLEFDVAAPNPESASGTETRSMPPMMNLKL